MPIQPPHIPTLADARAAAEEAAVRLAIDHTTSLVAAAEALGVSRPTLYRLMIVHGITVTRSSS